MEKMTFCRDLTYGFDQFPIAMVNACKEEIDDFEGNYIGEKISRSVIATNLTVEQVIDCLPDSFAINHIIGKHSGQCNPFDDYTHYYDGCILGYGNEDAAILFSHYRRNPDYSDFSIGVKEFISLEKIDWIELNVHKKTKDNIEMLVDFCKTVEAIVDKKILVYHKEKFYDLGSILSMFNQ